MKLRPFELALVIIFGGLALLALVLLSTADTSSQPTEGTVVMGPVTIWGTIPQTVMDQVLRAESEVNETYSQVSYQYISPAQFNDRLVNGLADGEGPDLILVSHEKLVETRRRIQPVDYESFPIRDIRNSYVDGAQIFALSDGLYAFPIAVDPLMMYWNRDILATEGILSPPATWEELVNSTFPEVISRDFNRTIERAVVAMGEYDNVRNAFGTISALLIQSGSELVQEGDRNEYEVRLQTAVGQSSDPFATTLDFYTRFSRPNNALYSWNRAFSEDRQSFIAEDLTLYFGYGSEGREIERINPNLNFDIAEIPQGAVDTVRRTYGKFYGLSLLRSSANRTGALAVMTDLGSARLSEKIATMSNMVPANRSLVAAGSNDTYGRVNYQSASIALGWLNPSLGDTDQIFSAMTKDVNENRRDVDGAVSDASVRLGNSYR